MKTARYVIALFLAIGIGWFCGLNSTGLRAVSLATQRGPASRLASPQTIRMEPVDATHIRLRLEGRENWIVESAGFSLLPTFDGPTGGSVRIVATAGKNRVTVPGATNVNESFELWIAPSGSLHFEGR